MKNNLKINENYCYYNIYTQENNRNGSMDIKRFNLNNQTHSNERSKGKTPTDNCVFFTEVFQCHSICLVC